jgi:FixJ family two-component response regulator
MSRIIHVDNSGFFRKIMRGFLSELGLESESFDLGRDALAKAKTGNVSCVITGLELPDMRGEDFIEQLASLKKPVSIIVFSASADENRDKFLETQGVLGMVQKTSNWKEELRKFFI